MCGKAIVFSQIIYVGMVNSHYSNSRCVRIEKNKRPQGIGHRYVDTGSRDSPQQLMPVEYLQSVLYLYLKPSYPDPPCHVQQGG